MGDKEEGERAVSNNVSVYKWSSFDSRLCHFTNNGAYNTLFRAVRSRSSRAMGTKLPPLLAAFPPREPERMAPEPTSVALVPAGAAVGLVLSAASSGGSGPCRTAGTTTPRLLAGRT